LFVGVYLLVEYSSLRLQNGNSLECVSRRDQHRFDSTMNRIFLFVCLILVTNSELCKRNSVYFFINLFLRD